MLVQTSTGFRYSTQSSSPHPAGEIPPLLEKSPALRVLVVDDEPLVRWSITETLCARGYGVLEAGDADAAMRAILDGEPPDIILLDLRLPDCNDLRLLETLRGILPSVAVILMTAFGTPEIKEQAYRLGAQAVIDKPFDLDELDPIIVGALK